MIVSAASIKKNAETSQLAEFQKFATSLPRFVEMIFIVAAIVVENSDTIAVARALRNDAAGIPVVASVIKQEADGQIVAATLRHAEMDTVLVIAFGVDQDSR